MSGGRVYPDKATFDAEVDRLTSVYRKLKVAAQKQGIEIETAARQAFESGEIAAADCEMVRLVLLGGRGSRAKPA